MLTINKIKLLDYNKIVGDITIRLGRNDDVYEGIGRGLINVENIPLYGSNIVPKGSSGLGGEIYFRINV